MELPYHNPPHIYLDETVYIISASTINKLHFFDSAWKKKLLFEHVNSVLNKFGWHLFAWVILDNHYHLLLRTEKDNQLGKFINLIHGGSSYQLNKIENKQRRKTWFNYWDTCVRNEKTFWTRFNYIHNNPVKHGYVDSPEKYEFSSYNDYLQKYGRDWLTDVWLKYPVIDFIKGEIKEPEGSIPVW